MLFVTVGNATQPFLRLLTAVDRLLAAPEYASLLPVVYQSGAATGFRPSQGTAHRVLSPESFAAYLAEADLVITHGGARTLIEVARLGRVPVAMPRRRHYREIVDDHQMDFVQAFAAQGRLTVAWEPADLPRAITQAASPPPPPPLPPPGRAADLIGDAITRLLTRPRPRHWWSRTR